MKSKKPEYATPHRIMGEAVAKLKGYHKEVYLLIVRDGKTPQDIAAIGELDEKQVVKLLDEAIKFVSTYCKQAIAKGRL